MINKTLESFQRLILSAFLNSTITCCNAKIMLSYFIFGRYAINRCWKHFVWWLYFLRVHHLLSNKYNNNNVVFNIDYGKEWSRCRLCFTYSPSGRALYFPP